MAQLPLGLLEADPPHLFDLIVVIGRVAAGVSEQEERDLLADRAPAAAIPVTGLAQLADGLREDPGLLPHLPLGRLDRGLPGVHMTLRQRQHPPAVRRA